VTKKPTIQSFLYASDRQRIVSMLVLMGEKAASLLENSVFALLNRDAAMARSVVLEDDTIDRMEEEIDQECLGSIAMRSPEKDELYFVFAVLKIITDLERIGDQAVNIAEKALRMRCETPFPRRESILEMLRIVLSMFRQALVAFQNEDKHMAAALWKRDDEVDAMYAECYSEFLKDAVAHSGDDPCAMEIGALELWTARHLERAGDHVINIVERVYFMVEGKYFPSKAARKRTGEKKSS
jgi:phosphate transport system protein